MNNKLIYGLIGVIVLILFVTTILPAFNAAVDRIYNNDQSATVSATQSIKNSIPASTTPPTTVPTLHLNVTAGTTVDSGPGNNPLTPPGGDDVLKALFSGAVGKPGQQVYYQFSWPMYYGVTSFNVAVLQLFLTVRGYKVTDHFTTFFGKLTSAALSRYQADHGLNTSGQFDPATQNFVNLELKGGFFPKTQ